MTYHEFGGTLTYHWTIVRTQTEDKHWEVYERVEPSDGGITVYGPMVNKLDAVAMVRERRDLISETVKKAGAYL